VTSGYVGALAVVTEQVWSFHPATNSWRREIDFPGTKRRFPVAWAIHDRGYIGTGTNGVNLNDFWQFNPIDNTIGIDEVIIDLNVYPNPFSNELSIDFNGLHGTYPLTISLIQLNGKTIFNTCINADQQSLDLAHLPAGSYLIQISNGHQLLKQQMLFKQ
jgi:allantoicase